jgi:hypothetical protein
MADVPRCLGRPHWLEKYRHGSDAAGHVACGGSNHDLVATEEDQRQTNHMRSSAPVILPLGMSCSSSPNRHEPKRFGLLDPVADVAQSAQTEDCPHTQRAGRQQSTDVSQTKAAISSSIFPKWHFSWKCFNLYGLSMAGANRAVKFAEEDPR